MFEVLVARVGELYDRETQNGGINRTINVQPTVAPPAAAERQAREMGPASLSEARDLSEHNTVSAPDQRQSRSLTFDKTAFIRLGASVNRLSSPGVLS
jgi:hypothetical protein